MKNDFLKKILYGMALLLFISAFSVQGLSQKKRTDETDRVLLFKIEKSNSPGGRMYSKSIFYFYQSGRIACDSAAQPFRGKEIKSKKANCLRVSEEKLNELVELAEQTDFLEAKDDYSFFEGGADHGKSFSITYYGKDGIKSIDLMNSRLSQNNEELPPSLTAFLEKIGEIDDALEVER